MAKDYIRSRQTRQKSSAPKQFFMVLASFLCGYLTATVFDFTSLTTWVNKNVLNQTKTEPAVKIVAKQQDLPKPKFEFYTLLSKDNSAPITVNRGAIPPSAKIGVPVTEQPSNSQTASTVTQLASQQAASQVATVTESRPVTVAAPANRESYLIQIASFPKRQDAEHVKATLVLKGFDVNIATTMQNKITWYRVIIGPFNSRQDAEKTQLAVARSEHMKGMIRKMGG